jgi:hypothetical protein
MFSSNPFVIIYPLLLFGMSAITTPIVFALVASLELSARVIVGLFPLSPLI